MAQSFMEYVSGAPMFRVEEQSPSGNVWVYLRDKDTFAPGFWDSLRKSEYEVALADVSRGFVEVKRRSGGGLGGFRF